MLNYYRYLPVSADDEKWGLSVLNAGCTRIQPNEPYPYRQHPVHHNFLWENGRTLYEYQLIYIVNGSGFFESLSVQNQKIEAGCIILLFPGEWHRYKPHPNKGWDEYWVGFNGSIIERLIESNFFQKSKPLINIGFNDEILALINSILLYTREEKAGYQQVISGTVLHLLGKLYSLDKQKKFEKENTTEKVITQAIVLLRSKLDEHISMETIAIELQVGYTWFRKTFKQYTGMAPHQYFIQLKIEKAKTLLGDLNKSVKEIAYELNFEYPLYFSKIFKKKVGLSPEKFRNNSGRYSS